MKGFYGTFKELSLRLQWKIKSKLTIVCTIILKTKVFKRCLRVETDSEYMK